METKNILQSKTVIAVVVVLIAIGLLGGCFMIGQMVGFRKAGFSRDWGDNYQRNFGGPRGGFGTGFGMMGGRGGWMMGERDLINGHGTAGQILKIDASVLVVKGVNDAEKTFTMTDKTTILRGVDAIKFSDLKVNDRVMIIGAPSADGQIEAKLIRVFQE
ncbi:MAG: hypothetical protein WCJ29_04330 [bacterium]